MSIEQSGDARPLADPLGTLTPDGSVPVVPWRRLDARMLLVHPVIELTRAIPALIAVVFAGSSSGHGSWWGLIGVGVVLTAATLRWFTTRFRITPERIELQHGLFRRKVVNATLDRVRTVDVTEHALHRALGLARVYIGTGTTDRKNDGLRLDGLTAREAVVLRAELLHRSPGQPGPMSVPVDPALPPWAAGPSAYGAYPQPDEQVLSGFRPSWVRFAPFTLSGAVTTLAVIGFFWRIQSETHANLERLARHNTGLHALRAQPLWAEIVSIVIVVLVFVVLTSAAGYVLAFWNFTLTRHRAGTLQVRRGLVTTRTTSIEERRLAGVELSEPLLLRLVGGARLLAIATGLRIGRGAERGGTVLLPAAPRNHAELVAEKVTKTARPWTAPLITHGARATRRRFTKATLASAILVALVGIIWWLAGGSGEGWLYSALVLPVMLLIALDRARALGHGLVDQYLVTRSGSLIRRRCALQVDTIIGWKLRSSYFARRAGLTTLVATTAAGRQGYRVLDIDSTRAIMLAEAAVPGLLTEFLADDTADDTADGAGARAGVMLERGR